MTRHVAVSLVALAVAPFQSSIRALTGPCGRSRREAWHPGCPVALSELRLLSVTYHGFDGNTHEGELVVNRAAAAPLARVFRQLYALNFPIRHMSIADVYGPARSRPADGDVSGGFECRQAVPSPCVGGSGTGSWSEHAFGEAVDLNPLENPYVGCGQSRDPCQPAVLQPLQAPPRDGHRRGDPGLPLDRVGLGRKLVRLDEGLHALLGVRALTPRPGSSELRPARASREKEERAAGLPLCPAVKGRSNEPAAVRCRRPDRGR